MRKKDLRSGMLVELKSGVVGLVVGECVIFSNKKQPLGLEYLTDDMKNKNEFNDFFDIIKVSNVKKWSGLWEGYWILENITNDLLWEREEKEMIDVDGVEYELDFVKKALDIHKTMDEAINPEETKEEKKEYVIEYKAQSFFILPVSMGEENINTHISNGLLRKTLKKAEYSKKRNQRSNRLEALVESLQGDLEYGKWSVFYDKVSKKYNMFVTDKSINHFGIVTMKEETAVKICQLLNDGLYSLDGEG